MILVLLACGNLSDLTDDGRRYTAGSSSGGEPCGEGSWGPAYCAGSGTCVDPDRRVCSSFYACETRYERYEAFDSDFCPVYGGGCTQFDLCDPDQRGCITSHANCTDAFEG